MVIKEQIKAENFSEEEENYLCKLVLLLGDSERVKNLTSQVPPLNERKRAEINAFARRYRETFS
jgi:transcriptional antiterminator